MASSDKGCARSAAGVIPAESDSAQVSPQPAKEVRAMQARVGHPAPDFEASAYFNGEFHTIKLSEHKGKWILLCFYPGDFTFV